MKNYPLSSFQKEQYTQYLETQLEKFSAFMLSQKKENERYQTLQNVIDRQNIQISKLSDKIRMLQLYQKENYRHCEKIELSAMKNTDFDHRLKKVESMYFEREVERQNLSSERLGEDFRGLKEEMSKKLRLLEKEIKKVSQERAKTKFNNENSPIPTNYSDVQSVRTNQNFASKFDLKKMEEKLHGFFEKNFNKIERMIRKSVNKSTKREQQKRRNKPEEIYIQEQTFGNSYNNFHDYEMENNHQKNIHDKSVSQSDTSGRLYPVQYYSQKEIEKKEQKRKSRKRISRSRSAQKSKSKSIQSKSRSISRSKSVKRKEKKESKKLILKTPTRSSHEKSKSKDKISIKEYRKSCKKKHF